MNKLILIEMSLVNKLNVLFDLLLETFLQLLILIGFINNKVTKQLVNQIFHQFFIVLIYVAIRSSALSF